MQKTRFYQSLSLIVCMVLIAAMALFTTGCTDNNPASTPDPSSEPQVEIKVLGEGETVFTFTVTDADGKESAYEIHTNKTVVGDALSQLGLIAGEEGAYGLYVKTVNGITVDYDTDGKYWAFYVNGEYAVRGVDKTDITPGATYSFKAE